MNILELDSYNLDDAVKFNDRLNPRLWDANEHLRPEVRDQLLRIADDFREFLGVDDLDLEDITISGSNAAYTYTPSSDIDLHLVVKMPADEVYRELFDAKKFQYNEQHNIKIGGYDVELYVQAADGPHISQGIYSVANNAWLQVPRRRRAGVDDTSTRNKYEKVGRQIEQAIKSGNLKRITQLAEKIKRMRQTGLESHGEFGPENLAFKMLRKQGLIKELYAAGNRAKDQELSLRERRQPHSVFTYGFKHEESRQPEITEAEATPVPSDEAILKDFIDFCFKELKLEQMPTIKLRRDPQWSVRNRTFGRYINDQHLLEVAWGHRHIMDVLRTVAHELTHTHQHERDGSRMGPDAGETGSLWENEANARAGILMRDYARLHPEYFAVGQAQGLHADEVTESASGYIPTKRQAKDPRWSMALTKDIHPGQLGKEANKLKLRTDSQGHPQVANPNGLFERLALELSEFKKKKIFTADDFRIDAFESIDAYRRWQQGPKTSSRGTTRYHANRYAGIFVDAKLVESSDTFAQRKAEAAKFGQHFKQLDRREGVKIAVGNSISVLSSTVVPGDDTQDSRVELSGFVTPKRIVKINLNSNNKIDTLEFSDGSRFPEEAEFTTVGGANITNTVLFSAAEQARRAYSQVWMMLSSMEGQGWKVEKHLSEPIEEKKLFALAEEQLAEVRMAPSNLQQWARSPEAEGIRAGFEAELIFRDTASGDDSDYEMEPDYDADERCRSIQQIIDFFQNGDYGGMSPRQEARLQDGLDEQYFEWQDEEMYKSWQDERDDLIREAWLKEKPMAERIHAALVDGMELSDEQADAVVALQDQRAKKEITGPELTDEQLEMARQYSEARSIADDILDEDVEQTIAKEDGFYDEVLQEFRDGFYVDDDSGFFDDVGLRWMSDVANSYDLEWPYMTGGGGNDGSRDWEEIGDSLHGVIDMPVKVSSNYHSTTRREGVWIVEPDSSLEPNDSDDFGLEIVSPPLPLEQALEKLQQVCDWANGTEGNAYTNSSTGLHMGVSVPFKGGDVDYLKLILFLGDEYVLKSFGREANTYCKSAMSKFKENIKGGRADPMGVIKLMQSGLLELAHKEIQKGVGEGKYTSAHIQKGYIEFRSAGGDWLAEENADPEKLQNTMLRYARAMSLAANPAEERREYAKKLYKLVAPEGDSELALFSQFASGELTAEQLKKRWAEKTIGKETNTNKRWKLFYADGTPVPGAEWNGYTEDQVKTAVWSKYGREALDSGEYELRNMSEEQQWEVYDVNTGETLEIVKGRNRGEVADKVYDKYADQKIGFNVRAYTDPATMTPRAKLAKRIATTKPEPKTQDIEPDVAQNFAEPAPVDATDIPRNWEFVDRITGRVIHNITNASYNQANVVQGDLERQNPDADIYLRSVSNLEENFADGKGPGRPGDSQRHGIPKGATMAELEQASHAKGRKGQLARWQLNMRRGKKK